MSGHSKWAQIKRQKGVADTKRGNLFTKLSNAIAVAVREGGKDPNANFKLRLAIEKAKSANMPNDNIERAIKRGAGEIEGQKIEEVTYEGFGPQGVAIVIETLTDNRNRTTTELRNLLAKYGGSLGGSNSVMWNFDKKGIIQIAKESFGDKSKEDLELNIIDAGADDVLETDDGLMVYTKSEELEKVKNNIEKQDIKIDYAEIELVAKNRIEIKDKAIQKKLEQLFGELNNHRDVDNVFTNYKEALWLS